MQPLSPLEVWQGAATLDVPLTDFLARLQHEGLSSLPGTAAEILDDAVRERLCPDKINTAQWLEVMAAAHDEGMRTTATIMYGHIDQPHHWASHLLHIRALQQRTGGFTEFVPLPFVHMEAPMYLKGKARPGPSFREALLMHAVARLVFFLVEPPVGRASLAELAAFLVRLPRTRGRVTTSSDSVSANAAAVDRATPVNDLVDRFDDDDCDPAEDLFPFPSPFSNDDRFARAPRLPPPFLM